MAGPDSQVTSDISVVIVDDSAVIRGLLKRWLGAEDGIEIVGAAGNGELAIKEVANCQPDVVVLDIEMPQMDGLTALPKILEAVDDVKVIMASTLTTRNAEISLQALSLGAADYLSKPESSKNLHAPEGFRIELVSKIRALGAARKKNPRQPAVKSARIANESSAPVKFNLHGRQGDAQVIEFRKPSSEKPEIIGIGSSTGGPQALQTVVKSLSGVVQPVLITQHIPATFTALMANQLSKIPGITCLEAEDGMKLEQRHVYLARGDYHMIVEKSATGYVIRINQDPPENYCRPAVDPMFRSIAANFGPRALTVVLTGMGYDGREGGKAVAEAGGSIVAQDEGTSIVWGMPGAVAMAGICSAVLPLDDIGPAIERVARGGAL
jgi:two-component system chemotaxis response regulator CheB